MSHPAEPRRESSGTRRISSTPLAILLLLFGLLLLATSVVRFVAVRDLQRGASTSAPGNDGLAIGLVAAGMLLGAAGLAVFVRKSRPILIILAGALLLLVAWAHSIFAEEIRRQDQARLDAEWNTIVQQSRAADPRALPPGKPPPAQLPGAPLRIALSSLGAALIAGGLWGLSRRSPPARPAPSPSGRGPG